MKSLLAFASFCFVLSPTVFARPPIEAYGRLPAVEMMSLSPSGKHYAYVATIANTHQVGVLDSDGKLLSMSDIGDVKARNMEWADDDHLLLTTTATFDSPLDFKQAYELSAVLNFDLATNKVSRIFDKTEQVANVVFGDAGSRRVDGHLYGYFIGLAYEWSRAGGATSGLGGYIFNGDIRHLYRVDLNTNELSLQVKGGKEKRLDWVVDRDGKVLANSEQYWDKNTWRLYAGGGTNRKQVFERTSTVGTTNLIGLGRSEGTVLISYEDSGLTHVEEIAIPSGNRVSLFEHLPAANFLYDPDNKLLIGATDEGGSRAVFFDERLQARFNGARKAFPGKEMQLISSSRQLERLLVKTEGNDDSGTYWLVDIAAGDAKPIGYAYPEIRARDVNPVRWFTYKTADGFSINAVLTLPANQKHDHLALVVLPHGGPIGVRDNLGFDWWAQAYASAGYAVLQPNYRGSSDQDEDFIRAGFGQWGHKMLTDISGGVTGLALEGIIDPNRVCIVGASYGGYAALAGVTLQHDIYRCAVSIAGPSDLPAFLQWQIKSHGYNSDRTRYWQAVTGANTEGDDSLKSISPSRLAVQASGPILLVHGKDDTVVPISQSEAMASALRDANKPVEFIAMEGEDHWLSRSETRLAMLKSSLEFVKKYNPPQ